MATDPLKYMIPIGTNDNQVTIGNNRAIEVVPGIFAPKRRIQFRSFGSDL